MPKLSNFKKALRLQSKAARHYFKNSALNHKIEPIESYSYENYQEVIKREHTYGFRQHKSKFPKGEL